jgi:GAF domain-containing protein
MPAAAPRDSGSAPRVGSIERLTTGPDRTFEGFRHMTDDAVLTATEQLMSRLTPADLAATLQAITNAAVEVLPHVDHSSITIRHADGRLDTYAVTDEKLIELDEHQFELREGPCYEGATETVHSVSSDLLHDGRYAKYGPIAADTGIRSQAGLRLFDHKGSVGALNLYAEKPGAFEDFAMLDRLFAHQAAVAISYSRQIDNLNEALRTRTVIGEAVGIVMARYGLEEQQAFAFLTRLSQTRNVKLREVARELVASVGGPTPPLP